MTGVEPYFHHNYSVIFCIQQLSMCHKTKLNPMGHHYHHDLKRRVIHQVLYTWSNDYRSIHCSGYATMCCPMMSEGMKRDWRGFQGQIRPRKKTVDAVKCCEGGG